MAVHVRAMLDFQKAGVHTVDYGNNIRQVALEEGVKNAFDFPGFVPAYIRPLFCRGVGPFRWVALSGDPRRHLQDRREGQRAAAGRPSTCTTGSTWRAQRIKFQGLPARICWVGLGDRHRLGLAFNEMVARGELKAPVVIGRDHLDSGSVASPNRETEAMKDGSDAVSDWPLLNALLNTASGATWVSLHHGGGVGMGFSQHAGVVIVCDGTEAAAKRIARVLWNDPATGVMRHADAGYDIAIETARKSTSSICPASCVTLVTTEIANRRSPKDVYAPEEHVKCRPPSRFDEKRAAKKEKARRLPLSHRFLAGEIMRPQLRSVPSLLVNGIRAPRPGRSPAPARRTNRQSHRLKGAVTA